MTGRKILLNELKPGECGIICGFNALNRTTSYLMGLGLIIGANIRVVKYAPFGDPIEVEILGYHLSIRREDAGVIIVNTDKED